MRMGREENKKGGDSMSITREKILQDALEMARHNLRCYSSNFSCTTPKEGHEKDYEKEASEIKILEAWLKEYLSTNSNIAREFIGHVGVIHHGPTIEKKSMAEYIEFEIDTGADYSYGDRRIFFVGPEAEVQDWFPGHCTGKYDTEKSQRNSRLLKITVDRINYIRSIEWAIEEKGGNV